MSWFVVPTMGTRIRSFIPVAEWLPNYNKRYLESDIASGITVGAVLIPGLRHAT